jgi:magnesium transporter
MVKTLFFDADEETAKVLYKYAKKKQQERGDVVWTHLHSREDEVMDVILKEIGQSEDFEEDLLEDQRPRLTTYRDFDVVVFSVPFRKIMTAADPEEGMMQFSFIVMRNKIISVSGIDVGVVSKVMERQRERIKGKTNVTKLISNILSEMVEHTIDVMEEEEKGIDSLEIDIVRGRRESGKVFQEAQSMKENLFYAGRALRADLEVIRELINGESTFVNQNQLNKYIEDRLLYAIDLAETSRESLNNITNLYLSALSTKMNENMYKLTIIGSILLVPTVIASLYGMNVPLPPLGFWEITWFSIVLSLAMVAALRIFRWI